MDYLHANIQKNLAKIGFVSTATISISPFANAVTDAKFRPGTKMIDLSYKNINNLKDITHKSTLWFTAKSKKI